MFITILKYAAKERSKRKEILKKANEVIQVRNTKYFFIPAEDPDKLKFPAFLKYMIGI